MNDLIYGCAEDALSLWALQQKIDVITGSNNKSRTERIIFYRPSFGRGPSKATFGEFDSIIIEKNRIFLIESKWVERPTKTTEVRLAKHQIDRHKILSWYIKHWQGENDWDTFYDKWANIFPNEIETGHKVPSSKTKLSKKLKFLLDKIFTIAGSQCEIINVILLFHPEGSIIPKVIVPEEVKGALVFQTIPIGYLYNEKSGFFPLIEKL